MGSADINKDILSQSITESCCNGTTGCDWDGTLRRVKNEPIYVQKVFDATLLNSQALRTIQNQPFSPSLGRNAQIIRVTDIRCRKYFNPANIFDKDNLTVNANTVLSGGSFVEDGACNPITVIGPDGTSSEKIIYVNTSDCDKQGRGTPVFGTQTVRITGNVVVEIDVVFLDGRGRRTPVTLKAVVPIASVKNPIVLTNFFELCVPSVFNSAFLPRFAEFCSVACETRLATNSITRDICIDPVTGQINASLIIAICITCEKKVVVPVQLCVLSTGFPVLSPIVSPICSTFPTLFPRQIDESSNDDNDGCGRNSQSLGISEDEKDECEEYGDNY